MSGKLNSSLTTAEWVDGRRSSSESSSATAPRLDRGSSVSRPSAGTAVRSDFSQLFTKWLMKKQQADSVLENDPSGRQQPSKQKLQMAGSIGPGGVVVGVGRGQLFPARLALALGMAKTLLGVLLVAFGALALWEQASMSYLGSGLWTGAVVVLSGLMGIMAGQKRTNLIYIVAYLLMSVLALAAIGLLLIFAATGLARDTDAPHGYFVDQEEGSRVEFLGTVPLKQRAIIINAVLVALGTLSTIVSLAAVVICLREACLCYGGRVTTAGQHRRLVNSNSSCTSSHQHKIGANRIGSVPNMNLLTADQSPEGQARAYRLLRWLRQSHHHQQQQQQQQRRPPPLLRRLYNPQVPMVAHPIPVAIPTTPAASGHPPVGFPSFVTGAPTAYVIPAGAMPVLQPMISGPAFYSLTSLSSLHHHHHAPGMPPPPSHMHHHANYLHREMASLPVVTASAAPSERNQKKEKKKDSKSIAADEKRCRRSRSTVEANDQPEVKEINKVDRSQQQRQHFFGMFPSSSSTLAKQPQQLTQQPLQSDVESMVSGYVYTGMDRDIAEEFILHSMTIPTPATQASSVKSGFSHQ
ncbi:hypothetical protein GHT06_010333 [Daphnia sinensis]|uniref:Uncharacterized protein n=1 Tax=Daphnia sinensis TaxID=1820382 RepID=A0AAD5KY16_9CRUS|nr:hypothetical protein GHT06_010333 [Daphnia sinensis]